MNSGMGDYNKDFFKNRHLFRSMTLEFANLKMKCYLFHQALDERNTSLKYMDRHRGRGYYG